MALDLADLDLTRMEARVNGKTGFRVLDFGEVTSEALKVWLDVRPKTDPVAVFTTREGRISHRCIYTHFEDLAADLGVKRFNPHSIRHRVGQSWVDSGANLELVRLKLGHKDVTTTARFYTHQDRERVKRASRKYSVIGGMQK
jgi:site-specific recombinase XerC